MYAYENYRKVKDIIEARRVKAIADAEAKNIEVAALSEDIRIIDAEMRGVGLLLFKTACSGGDINEIRKRNLFLGEQRRKALVKLGLPEDYTEVKYTCKLCSDSGFIETKMCKCFREMLITENIKSSGMGTLIEKQSFENFNLDFYKNNADDYERMKNNFEYAKKLFKSAGYKLPEVVFWNVASRNTQQPVTRNEQGVALVSGCTPRIFSMIAEGVPSPYEFMMSVLESDRYKNIAA